MTPRRSSEAFAWITLVFAMALTAAGLFLEVFNHPTGRLPTFGVGLLAGLLAVSQFVASAIGVVVAGREDDGRAWPLGLLGLGFGAFLATSEYATYAFDNGQAAGELSAWVSTWMPGALASLFVVTLLLSPDGRLTSRISRVAALPLLLACVAGTVVLACVPGTLAGFPAVANPYALESLAGMRDAGILALGSATALAAVLATIAVVRRRRRDLEQRRPAPAPAVLDTSAEDLTSRELRHLEEQYRAMQATGSSFFSRARQRRRQRKETSPWRYFRDISRIKPYLKPYWKLATVSILMIGLTSLVALLTPWPLAILIDAVLENNPLPSLLGPLGGLDRETLLIIAVASGLLVTAAQHGLGVLDQYVTVKLEQKMVLDFRSDLFRHAQALSMSFHDRAKLGGLMYQMNDQASAMGGIAVALPQLATALLTLVGMFVVAYRIDAQLALLALTVVPFVYYSAGYYARKIEPRLFQARSLEGQSLTLVHEAMSMMRVIVSFGRERHEHRRFREQGETAVKARVNVTLRQTLFSLAVSVLTAAGTALVLGFGAYHALQKQISPGELLVVMGYIAAIYMPLEQISVTMSTLQEQFISFRGALDLMDKQPDVREAPGAVVVGRVEGRIEFEQVDFRYKGRTHTLRGISFVAGAGRRTAIVGPTGAGKTTLVSLIPRFYDVRRGRITLDGIDIREITLDSLRAQISIVLQEPLLFSVSIRENIRYGRLEASDEEIEQAARAANAHGFICELPEGYDTELGERGSKLSVGERQRISMARAFLKDAPILLLDEPTAAIDSRTEGIILDALQRLMGGRTTIMIAHRLSTVRNADHIVVINQGGLVEQGSHDELVTAGGLYQELYDAQIAQPAEPTLLPIPDLDEDIEIPDYWPGDE